MENRTSIAEASIRVGRASLSEYLWLHPGTEHPAQIADGGEPYTASARVPVAERRPLSADELAAITAAWHWPPSNCVSSFPVDRALLTRIPGPETQAVTNPQSEEFRKLGETLWQSLCEMTPVFSLGPTQWLGVSRRPSGLRTSTCDTSIGRRIGLHLDSWDRSPLNSRHTARTRLCINLGLRTRSLLFLPYDIRAVAGALADDPLAHSANLGERFCTRFREAPILQFDVPPGWAYLAPTENIVHDGCSEPSEAADLTVAWLGRIGYFESF